MNIQVIDTLTTILSFVTVTGGIGFYQIKKITKIEKGLKELREEHIQSREILSNVAFTHDAYRKISHLVMDACKYLQRQKDLPIAALVMVNSDAAKNCIEWGLECKMENVTTEDFLIKYESLSVKLRDYLDRIDPVFYEGIKKELSYKGKKYINRVKVIIEDKTPNSRVLRFVTATEVSLQEIISFVIREWLAYSGMINNNHN